MVGIREGISVCPQEGSTLVRWLLDFSELQMPDVTPRVRSYRCSVAGRTVNVSSTRATLRDARLLPVDAGVTFKSCTAHAGCGKFPRGLPVDVGVSQSTGCAYVDTGVIFEGW